MIDPLTSKQQTALLQINSARRRLERFADIAKTSRVPEVSVLGYGVSELTDEIWFASLDLGVGKLLLEEERRRGSR